MHELECAYVWMSDGWIRIIYNFSVVFDSSLSVSFIFLDNDFPSCLVLSYPILLG